ncbi:MAG: SAM-dependent methyltransferase [Rhodoferax sp.]|jgi:SAM-dependent MidA family methyltransferase|nr:SAM-dependent methyltransferase [Rhodoferax sp.]
METVPSLTSGLGAHLREVIAAQGGWIGFDRFMHEALYAPGRGYYARDAGQFGRRPSPTGGGDFVTAPEMSRFFGATLAVQVAQALQQTGTREIWEFGAGSGALADQLLTALGPQVERYTIVDVSGSLRARQRDRLRAHAGRVHWADALPPQLAAVVVGNEVLDAMPVQLLARQRGTWQERGVSVDPASDALAWQDRPSGLRPPLEIPGAHDYLTEIHPQAEGFVRLLGDRLARGAVFLIDYGFPEREYYHPQRSMGTVMCHRGHRMDADPLSDVGEKDITAHVNFTGLALAAQELPDFGVLGYTSQARFLLNCGLPGLLEGATLAERTMAQKLLMEHEMGELFKVIGFWRGAPWEALGFAQGDRTHTL